MSKRFRLMLLVFIVSFTSLGLEMALTRIYSYLLWYHYVFAAISVSIMGIGFGSWLAYQKKNDELIISRSLIGMAASSTLILPGVFFFSVTPMWILSLGLSLVPFIFVGRILTVVFLRETAASTRLYFADLTGAAVGALATPFIVNSVGPVGFIIVLSALLLLLNAVLKGTSKKTPAVVGALALAGLLIFSQTIDFARIFVPPHKTLGSYVQGSEELKWFYTDWNAFSRIDVVADDEQSRAIFVDGGAGTRMYRFDGELTSLSYLVADLSFLPFAMKEEAKALIIGSGGGKEVLQALLGKSRNITAVDVNPAMFEVVEKFADFSGDLYNRPEVKAVVADGRGFVERNPTVYDIVFLPLVFTQAAEVQGYALAENYVFTEEAFHTYYERLTSDGYLALRLHNENELVRTMVTWLRVLQKKQGISVNQGLTYIAAFGDRRHSHGQTGSVSMPIVLLKKAPFSPSEIHFLHFVAAEHPGAEVVHLPEPVFGGGATGYLTRLRAGEMTLDEFIDSVQVDVRPATDDWPFFYKTRRGLPLALTNLLGLVLAAGLLFAGVAVRESIKRRAGWTLPLYFALLGIAFMMVELPLLQRLTLLFGTPLQAMAVTLFALLLSGGIGSYVGGLLPKSPATLARMAAYAAGVLAVGFSILLPGLVDRLLIQSSAVRMAGAVALVAPIGFVMGIPFPSGLKHFGVISQKAPALGWAVNGFFSVVGSILTVAIAMLWGQSAALLVGGVVYFLAGSPLLLRKS